MFKKNLGGFVQSVEYPMILGISDIIGMIELGCSRI